MTARRKPTAAPGDPSTSAATPPLTGAGEKAKSNNDRWDDDEEPWRHPPVAPKDESPAESLGRSVSDVVIGSAGTAKDKAKP
jgi:hypothetical protein